MFWVKFINFIDGIHLMRWSLLIDVVTRNKQNRNSKNKNNSATDTTKGGARLVFVPVSVFFYCV